MYSDNLARKYESSKIPVTRVKKKKKLKVNVANTLKLLSLLACFVIGSFLVLSVNVMVTEQSKKVAELKKEYSALETENRKREIEISRKVDIATVEERAISVCNMNRARQDQIQYINVQAEDYGIVTAQNNKDEEKSGIMWGLLAYLK